MKRPFALPPTITVSPPEKYDQQNEAAFRAQVAEAFAAMVAASEARYAGSFLELKDGLAAPGAAEGKARVYTDAADGDLKVVFADGVVKTLATDT